MTKDKDHRVTIPEILPSMSAFPSKTETKTETENNNSRHSSESSQSIAPIHIESPDFVLVWNAGNKYATTERAVQRRAIFEFNLQEEGLLLEWENSKSAPDLHVLKIAAPLEVLQRYCEIMKLRLPMKDVITDMATSHAPVKKRKFSKSIVSIKRETQWIDELCRKCCQVDNYDEGKNKSHRLTEVYSRDRQYLFDLDETNVDEVIPPLVRSRIVRFILCRTPFKDGEDLQMDAFAIGYERLVQKGMYEAGYPLHDGSITTRGSIRKTLYDKWGNYSVCCKDQPLDMIKDYFGVNFALYFAWVGFYTRMLTYAAIIGILCLLYGVGTLWVDQYVFDVCNETKEIIMCPLCDHRCEYWDLSEKCGYVKFAYIFDNEASFFFAFAMSVWAAIFLELWKRYTARITYHWDLSNFDIQKDYNPRPEFVAELKKIYPHGIISGTHDEEKTDKLDSDKRRYDFELAIPFWSKVLPFRLLSVSTVILLIVMALAAMAGVVLYRLWFSMYLFTNLEDSEMGFGWMKFWISVTSASLNLAFIFIFNRLYKKIARYLTEKEFPRTQEQYEASYILKIFALQFVNNYSSIFYIAFFKGSYSGAPHDYKKLYDLRQEECGLGCMPELCIQLAVILIGRQMKHLFVGATLPCLKRAFKKLGRRMRTAKTKDVDEKDASAPQWLRDYDLLNWESFSLIDEHLEITLQFGFVTIFVAAFPIAPMFAILHNLIDLRLAARKILTHYKKPIGYRTRDLGIWNDIIVAIVGIAVFTNAAIIALTSSFIPKFMYRFVLQKPSNPTYGSLEGYLNHSLTKFKTSDLESKPSPSVIAKHGDSEFCSFMGNRYSYDVVDTKLKYSYTIDHWMIVFARVLFVLLYQNFVNILITLVSRIIPDMPSKLRGKIRRDERMVSELIVKHEAKRARKFNLNIRPTNEDAQSFITDAHTLHKKMKNKYRQNNDVIVSSASSTVSNNKR